MAPRVFDRAFLGRPHPMLDLGEGPLNGVEIGGLGRQEAQARTGGADHLTNSCRFVRAQIVHDDDVAGPQDRHELLGDIGAEAFTVDRTTSVVVALPCRTCPITNPSADRDTMHHDSSGPDTNPRAASSAFSPCSVRCGARSICSTMKADGAKAPVCDGRPSCLAPLSQSHADAATISPPRSWAPRSAPASSRATGPMGPGGCGTT